MPKSKAEDIISVHKGKERQYIETKSLEKRSTLEQSLTEQVAFTWLTYWENRESKDPIFGQAETSLNYQRTKASCHTILDAETRKQLPFNLIFSELDPEQQSNEEINSANWGVQ